jgi:predicted ester cyclase
VTPWELRAWYEDYLEVCNRHDLAGIRERLAPDVRRAGEASGADAWVRDVEDLLTAFPDYRWKRIALVVEDDRVAAHLRTRGTHRGDFRGLRPTGRHVGVAEFAFYRVVGGRIVEYAGTADDAGLLAQLTR